VNATADDDHALAGMLRAGAAGFVLKGIPAEDLQRAVRTGATGGAWRRDARHTGWREREVLELIAAGMTNEEIANELVVSPGTVKTHVNHIYFKLEVRNRSEAVLFAFDNVVATTRKG